MVRLDGLKTLLAVIVVNAAALNPKHMLSSPVMMTLALPWALCFSAIKPKNLN